MRNRFPTIGAGIVWMLSLVSPVLGEPGGDPVVRLSEPVVQSATTETFGEQIDWSLPKRSLDQLLSAPQSHLGKPFLLETEIVQVCQKKGCFFIARDGSQTVRVAFRGYRFFVPTDSGGKKVTLVGELVTRHMSEAEATHYAEDLGEKAGMPSGTVFEIVADGVQIPRNS